MNKKRWQLLLLLVLVVIGTGASIYMVLEFKRTLEGDPQRIRAYKQALNSLPNPPGWQSDTDYVAITTGADSGNRYYTVTGQYTDVVTFFKTKLTQKGWELFREEESIPPKTQPGEQRGQGTSFIFYSVEHYCLNIRVSIQVDRQLVQIGDEVKVHIILYEAESKFRCDQ